MDGVQDGDWSGDWLDLGDGETTKRETEVDIIMAAWDLKMVPNNVYRVRSDFVVAEAEYDEYGGILVPEWRIGGYVIARNKHLAKCETVSWTNLAGDLECGERARITDTMSVETFISGVFLPQQFLCLRQHELDELFRRIQAMKEATDGGRENGVD